MIFNTNPIVPFALVVTTRHQRLKHSSRRDYPPLLSELHLVNVNQGLTEPTRKTTDVAKLFSLALTAAEKGDYGNGPVFR